MVGSGSYADRLAQQYQQQFGKPASADDPNYAAYIQTAMPQMLAADKAAYEKSKARWRVADRVATGATLGVLGAGVGTALMGGASAAGAGSAAPTINGWSMAGYAPSVAASGTGAAGAGMSIPWLSIGGKASDTLFGIYANKKQAQANREALAMQQRASAEAMAYERERDAEAKRQFDAQQAELRRQWEATQAFEKSKWDALEEERLYNRRVTEEDRQLKAEREARKAPYIAASQAALAQLPGIIASGATSPGLGSLRSYGR
jgi:hypothetical protein